MVCRCSSPQEHARRAAEQASLTQAYTAKKHKDEVAKLRAEIAGLTINAERFEVLNAEEVGGHLVMRVKYPSCQNCSHEGVKVMVFSGASAIDALRWKRIDPHFRGPESKPNEAPSPVARFPGTDEGWENAVAFAGSLVS